MKPWAFAPTLGLLLLAPAAWAQDEQELFEIGDKVEIHVNGSHWQKCEVTENDPQMYQMKVKCKEYRAPSINRAAGMYGVDRGPNDVRRDKTASAQSGGVPAGLYK